MPIVYEVDFESSLERSQQWEILNTHPFFTGVCPNCGAAYPQNLKIIHYDCQSCGWIDDSLGLKLGSDRRSIFAKQD